MDGASIVLYAGKVTIHYKTEGSEYKQESPGNTRALLYFIP